MRVTYLILCHFNPEQVAGLVNQLSSSDKNNFVIHIDKTSNPALFKEQILSQLGSCSNVYFTKKNINVKWGGVSFLYAIRELIKTVFEQQIIFDYLSLISVQCFPVKTNDEISQFLESHVGYSFVEMQPYSDINKKENRLNRYYFYDYYVKDYNRSQILNLPWRIITKIAPKRKVSFNPFWGRVWWFLWKDHANVVLQAMSNKNLIFSFLKHSLLPEEIFFASFLHNSSFCNEVMSQRTTYADYSQSHPGPIDSKLATELRKSDFLFARKFIIDSEGYKTIKELLQEK